MSSVTQSGVDFGMSLTSSAIEAGLRELNPDINFDVAVRKPEEFGYSLQTDPVRRRAIEQGRLPVCHLGRYICSMDRGMVPEFKVWGVQTTRVEIDWREADLEDASIQYETIPPSDPTYDDLRSDAERGQDDGLQIMPDGRLARMRCFATKKSRGRVLHVGWRFTFHNLINADIPGVTVQTINKKFNVDMSKIPVGSPEELHAALVEE